MEKQLKVIRKLYIGMIGAALMMISEWLLFSAGTGNKKAGIVQSNWIKMPYFRFEAGLVIAAIGIIFVSIGLRYFTMLIRSVRRKMFVKDDIVASVFRTGALLFEIGAFYIHAVGAFLPILYKLLYSTTLMGADIVRIIDKLYYYMAVFYWIFLVLSIIGISIPYMYFVRNRRIKCIWSAGFVSLLNPMIFVVIGLLIRIVKVAEITDFTSASASFGLLVMFFAGIIHLTEKMARIKKSNQKRNAQMLRNSDLYNGNRRNI